MTTKTAEKHKLWVAAKRLEDPTYWQRQGALAKGVKHGVRYQPAKPSAKQEELWDYLKDQRAIQQALISYPEPQHQLVLRRILIGVESAIEKMEK